MCRWMAWTGQPLIIEELLFAPPHGLIDQSLHSRMGVETTNGDGFGLGWYGAGDGPAVYRSVAPAWGDENLRELAAHVESPLFIAHVRATTGTAIQQTNCHPFRHGRWLFVHNGVIAGFAEMRRELMLAIDPSLFPAIQGSTDSEVLFNLALTFGLEEDPVGAVERAVGFVEATARRHGWTPPFRRAWGSPTASACGRFATRRRESRGPCSTRPTPRPCGASIPRTSGCSGLPTRTASSCPSRCRTCRACGRRSPSRRC